MRYVTVSFRISHIYTYSLKINNVENIHLQSFNSAAERIKTLTKRPTDQELLELYALFKQGTFGDNNTS